MLIDTGTTTKFQNYWKNNVARSILVSDAGKENSGGVGFAYNGMVFDAICEGIRAGFLEADQICMRKCFEDLDDLGLGYICLYEVDQKCFVKFAEASKLGLDNLRQRRVLASDCDATEAQVNGIIALWEELQEALYADLRNEK